VKACCAFRSEQSQVRGGQDDVLHFLHTCMDDIHRDMCSGDSDTGQHITPCWPLQQCSGGTGFHLILSSSQHLRCLVDGACMLLARKLLCNTLLVSLCEVGRTVATLYLRLYFVLYAIADDIESKPDV